MPTYESQHALSIEVSGTSIRWRLTVGPRSENNPQRAASRDDVSFEVILELVEPVPVQLDFGF